ncbi:DNA primase [Candidatus Parcubacteria bacterium]|nr:DNA primase [Candidatus Parcubacteria bacterium]
MRGNVEAIKERLSVEEVIGSYVQLQKAGQNFKAKCPFHNEKTASFMISPSRQSYYCFGCGARGDIFTFVKEMEGVDFKQALRTLADRAGVELTFERGEGKNDKDKLYSVLEDATLYFENELKKSPEALKYLAERGVNEGSIKTWRLGYVPEEWRLLREFMSTLGHSDEVLIRAGLIKRSEDHKDKEPYDVFRGRIIFPLFDPRGQVIAFSGRALGKDVEPKYLNSPDTPLFTKSEVLYGLDKAREDIRRKDYAILVEGQLDLVLSHQAGVRNTVASSGTAFTEAHLERLKRLSPRIILAFDGDTAGVKAAEKSTILALSLGMEVKVAKLPDGKDPADLAKEDPERWKDVLRSSKSAIEIFLDEVLKAEKDSRKIGKAVEKKILPILALVQSAIERSHFVSLIAKRTGIREEVILEDLKRVKAPEVSGRATVNENDIESKVTLPLRDLIEERLKEVLAWQKDFPEASEEGRALLREESLLRSRLTEIDLEGERKMLQTKLFRGEGGDEILREFEVLSRKLDEGKRRI